MKIKNNCILALFSVSIGLTAGAIIWLFTKLMSYSIMLLWDIIPNSFDIPFYTIIVCTIGGIIIGLWQKKFGAYPETLETVMAKVKKDKKYPYSNLPVLCVSALLPLIFGGSIGPEAGLTGIIAAICTWISDRYKLAIKEINELSSIGISATLGVIFNSPIFGFIEPIESEVKDTTLPKLSKIVVYLLSAFSALGIFYLLNKILGGKVMLPKFAQISITASELYMLLPLILIGVIFGFLFLLLSRLTKSAVKPIEKFTILRCTISGLILGIAGYFLPLSMFSGEEEINTLMNSWLSFSAISLIILGALKLLITNTCLNMGIRGGHFFPVIFAGISLGYGFSLLLNVDPVFSIVIITAAMLSYTLKKPLATALLLMICFPIEAFIPILLAAVAASAVPTPKFLK